MLTKDQVEKIELAFPFPTVLALCAEWREMNKRLCKSKEESDGFRAEALSALAERDQFRLRLTVKQQQLNLARLAIREIYTYMMNDMGFSGDDMRCISASSVQLDAALSREVQP